ncbi:hypothetical protein Leryth_026756, partial [Lithospermum erythrorhizon]
RLGTTQGLSFPLVCPTKKRVWQRRSKNKKLYQELYTKNMRIPWSRGNCTYRDSKRIDLIQVIIFSGISKIQKESGKLQGVSTEKKLHVLNGSEREKILQTIHKLIIVAIQFKQSMDKHFYYL